MLATRLGPTQLAMESWVGPGYEARSHPACDGKLGGAWEQGYDRTTSQMIDYREVSLSEQYTADLLLFIEV